MLSVTILMLYIVKETIGILSLLLTTFTLVN